MRELNRAIGFFTCYNLIFEIHDEYPKNMSQVKYHLIDMVYLNWFPFIQIYRKGTENGKIHIQAFDHFHSYNMAFSNNIIFPSARVAR